MYPWQKELELLTFLVGQMNEFEQVVRGSYDEIR